MVRTTGEDYYDIADDELPSANFAGRPTCEISDLGFLDFDGLCTYMTCHRTDGEDEFNDDQTLTALTTASPLMPQPEMPSTPPDTLAIKVASLSRRQSLRQHLKRVSDVAAIVKRPSIRKKAGTAPPGAFASSDYAPQVLQRSMSAQLDTRETARARVSRHLSSESDLKRSTLDPGDRNLEETPGPPTQQSRSQTLDENVGSNLVQPNASFSRKTRVRETLERKKLSRLRMNFVAAEPDDLVDSPESMLDTPEELYAAPQPRIPLQLQPVPFRPTSAIHGRRGSSTPVSPKTPLPFATAQPPNNNAAADEDFEDLHLATTYIPGPICLMGHPAVPRSKSVGTLEPFAGGIGSDGRRPSDLLILEQIVAYFDGMGMKQASTDECLDRYWLEKALHETELDMLERGPLTPVRQHSTSSRGAHNGLSRFSFSSASSGASVPQDSPQKRQLIRLRRLLSPALPGLKGFEG